MLLNVSFFIMITFFHFMYYAKSRIISYIIKAIIRMIYTIVDFIYSGYMYLCN